MKKILSFTSVALGCVLAFGAAGASRADYTIRSTFDASAEGWAPVNDVTLSWSQTGGFTGGFLTGTDKASGAWWYYGAPPKFLGAKRAAYGRTLSFQLKQSDATPDTTTEPNVVLASSAVTLVLKFAADPGTAWTPYTLHLDETGGWRVGTLDGPAPTQAQFEAAIASVTRLEIRGEYSGTADVGGLDEVVMTLSGSPPVPVLPIFSTFDANSESWRALGNTTGADHGLTWLHTGGNPDGCVRASDNTSDTWYFVAPPAYTGDLSTAYGKSIRFDLKQAATDSQFVGPDVVLNGEALTLAYDTAANPATSWTNYAVPLLAGDWRVGALDGAVATEAEIRSVLTSLIGFRIRGEYRSGADTAWLDNVYFGAGGTVFGDADGNGVVSAADVARILQHASGLLAAPGVSVMDVAPRPSANPAGYGDGRVDLLDAARVLRYLRGLETVWP